VAFRCDKPTMLMKLSSILCLVTLSLKSVFCGPVNVLLESNGKSLKVGEVLLGDLQEVDVKKTKFTSNLSYENQGLLRKAELHLKLSLSTQNTRDNAGLNCHDIKLKGHSNGNGMYWLDPDGGSHSNAFLAYCDMTSFNKAWTMCYTTDDKAKPKTEVTYSAQIPYGTDGYRTNCNNIPFTEIIFIDHQSGNKAYFKRRTHVAIKAAGNYGKAAGTYGLWDGVGSMNSAFSYQLLICDTAFYTGFFVSGYTSNCYKQCNNWCGDRTSPYFRTSSTNSHYKGVAFNTNGHHPNVPNNRLMSVGLR